MRVVYIHKTYLQSSVAEEVLTCSVISCCVFTPKVSKLGWPGLGPLRILPSVWYKHCSTRKPIIRALEQKDLTGGG